jgi:AcrR family transcriptional regulator
VTAPISEPDTRKRGRPPDVDSAATRARLLHVARRLFSELGYDATTNRGLAEAAGLTTGAIYHYFSSKAAIYEAAYQEVQDVVYGTLAEVTAGQPTLIDQLDAMLDAAVELNNRDQSLAGFALSASFDARRHPELQVLLAPMVGRGQRFLRGLVDDAAARGELPHEMSEAALADLLFAVLLGLANLSSAVGDTARQAAAIGAMRQCLHGALLRPTAAARR